MERQFTLGQKIGDGHMVCHPRNYLKGNRHGKKDRYNGSRFWRQSAEAGEVCPQLFRCGPAAAGGEFGAQSERRVECGRCGDHETSPQGTHKGRRAEAAEGIREAVGQPLLRAGQVHSPNQEPDHGSPEGDVLGEPEEVPCECGGERRVLQKRRQPRDVGSGRHHELPQDHGCAETDRFGRRHISRGIRNGRTQNPRRIEIHDGIRAGRTRSVTVIPADADAGCRAGENPVWHPAMRSLKEAA